MTARCAAETASVLSPGKTCPEPDELAGWCVAETTTANAFEATTMMVSAMANCDGNKMACETFVGGVFEAAPGCGGADHSESVSEAPAAAPEMGGDYSSMEPPLGGVGDTKCIIAPGK